MNNIGRTIYGYCNGYFGRDSYGKKRIEAEGYDWLVVREQGRKYPLFCYFESPEEKQKLIEGWTEDTDPYLDED